MPINERGSHTWQRKPGGAVFALVSLIHMSVLLIALSPGCSTGVSDASSCVCNVTHVLTSLSRIIPDALRENKTQLPQTFSKKLYEEASAIKWAPF